MNQTESTEAAVVEAINCFLFYCCGIIIIITPVHTKINSPMVNNMVFYRIFNSAFTH